MAEIRVVSPEELAAREQKAQGTGRSGRRRSPERTRIIEQYKSVLQDAQPGYGADVFLAEGEDKRIVRQNLSAAAQELNVALDFRPIKDRSRIHFRIITIEEKASRPKRGGRPRKSPAAPLDVSTAPVPEAEAEPAKPRKRAARTTRTNDASTS